MDVGITLAMGDVLGLGIMAIVLVAWWWVQE